MNKPTRDEAVQLAVKNANQTCDIICRASVGSDEYAKAKLQSAHEYIYAAMLTDFVRDVEKADWIGPLIQKPDSVVPTREWLIDHLFDVLFQPLYKKGGTRFLAGVRSKALKLLASSPQTQTGGPQAHAGRNEDGG